MTQLVISLLISWRSRSIVSPEKKSLQRTKPRRLSFRWNVRFFSIKREFHSRWTKRKREKLNICVFCDQWESTKARVADLMNYALMEKLSDNGFPLLRANSVIGLILSIIFFSKYCRKNTTEKSKLFLNKLTIYQTEMLNLNKYLWLWWWYIRQFTSRIGLLIKLIINEFSLLQKPKFDWLKM